MSLYSPAQRRDAILRAVHFDRPDYIPMTFHINEACWDHYPAETLKDLMAEHKFLFPDFEGGLGRAELDYLIPERVGKPFTDDWGCMWETTMNGIVGCVTSHPLSNWDRFDGYQPPDPAVRSGKGHIDWGQVETAIESVRNAGGLTMGGLGHGHTFQRLTDIRGYENLLLDMANGDPRLGKLIDMVEEFNVYVVQRYLKMNVEWMGYPEDLGMQNGPMLSPKQFRKYIKPSYERLMASAREKGLIVHMHSDGYIHDLADDLIDGGVNAINLQDLVNGIDWIKNKFKGKVCIDLDIDRQKITPKGSPADVDELIRQEVKELGSKEGGLMMIYGLYPGVPPENIKALMDAMERYAFYYSS